MSNEALMYIKFNLHRTIYSSNLWVQGVTQAGHPRQRDICKYMYIGTLTTPILQPTTVLFNKLDKKLYCTLSLSTQVYKWVPVTIIET